MASFSAAEAVRDFEKLVKLGPKVRLYALARLLGNACAYALCYCAAQDALLKRELYAVLLTLQDLSLIHVLGAGPTGAGSINGDTAVVLNIPPLEAKALFTREDLRILDKVVKYHR